MPETEDYISKVHKALSENVEGFKTDTAEFRDKISKNPEYADKVYTALKENLNGFDKSQQDFFDAVKKKEPTQSKQASTPPVTGSSKESTSSGGFLETLSQGINQKLQSASGTSESAPSKSESSKTNFEQRIANPSLSIKNPDGSESTHKMMSFEADGKYYAAPTIVEQNGKLKELSQDAAADYALKNKEYKEFKTEKEAQAYAEGGYKKGTPLENYKSAEDYNKNKSPYSVTVSDSGTSSSESKPVINSSNYKQSVSELKNKVKDIALTTNDFNSKENIDAYAKRLEDNGYATADVDLVKNHAETVASNAPIFKQLQSVLKKNPNDKDANYQLGAVELNNGDYNAAINFFTKSLTGKGVAPPVATAENPYPLKVASSEANALYGIGYAKQKMGQDDEALQYYQDALKKDPSNANAIKGTASIAYKRGDKDVAAHLTQKAQQMGAEKQKLEEQAGQYRYEKQHENDRANYLNSISDSLENMVSSLNPATAIVSGVQGGIEQLKTVPEVYAKEGAVSGGLRLLSGTAETALGVLMATPEGIVFNTGAELANTVLPEQVSKLLMSPISSALNYIDVDPSEAEKSLASIGDVVAQALIMKGIHGGAEGIKEIGEKFKKNEPITREEYATLQQVIPELKPEEIQDAAKQVSETKHTPSVQDEKLVTLENKKKLFTDKIAEGNLSNETKSVYGSHIKEIDDQIEKRRNELHEEHHKDALVAVNEEKINNLKSDLAKEENEDVKSVISAQIKELEKSKPIIKTNESESNKKTSKEGEKSQESGSEKGVLNTPSAQGEGSSPEATTTPPAPKGAAGGVSKSFEELKVGDKIIIDGIENEVVGRSKSRKGNDVIEIKDSTKKTKEEIKEMALNDISNRRGGMAFNDIEKYHGGQLLNLISDYTKREESRQGQTMTMDKEVYDRINNKQEPKVLTPELDSYIHSLPEEEMVKLESDLKGANTVEKEQALKKQFEENSGLKISDEEFKNLGKGVTDVLHDQESTINETIKPQENAIEKGIEQQNGEQQYPQAQEGKLSNETSDSNSSAQGREEQAAKEKVRNIQSLPNEDYVSAFIDSGQLISVGTQNTRFDIGHIFQGKGTIKENLEKAIASIKEGGKLTADAQRLKEVILQTKRTGEVPMIEGVGGTSRGTGVNVPVQEFREDIIKSAPEPKPVDENEPETISHQGEKYTINRDEKGNPVSAVDSKGVEVNPNDGPSELKLFNKIVKIAEVKKNEAAAVSKVVAQSERAESGLAELEKVEPRRWNETVLKEAEQQVKSGEVNPIRLLAEVQSHPRTLSDTETAILVKHKADMKKEYNSVLKQISEAKEGEDITHLLVKQLGLEEESAQFEKVFHDVIRPSAGRSLAALNMMMKPDYSLFNVVARGKAAEVGGAIPERVKEIYKKQSDRISELEKQIEENEVKLKEAYDKFSDEFKKTDASKNIRRQRYIQEAEERKSGRKVTKEEIKVERNQILENLKKLSIEQRSTLSANPINAKMIVEIGKLVNNYVKEGIVDFSQIVDDIHLSLKDIIPNVSKEDIENAITESALKEASAEVAELSSDVLYSKFKLGLDRTIDEIKKTSKNKNEANKKIKEIEKNSNYVKEFYDKAKKSEIEKKQAEKKVEDTLKDRKNKNRPRFIKILEGIKNGYKALILSGIKTPIKLGSAVVNIVALKPSYQGIGNLLSKIPFVGDIYKKAPLQKMGVDEMAKYYSTLATKEMFKESYRTLVGKSQFDVKNIDKQYHDSKILGFPGRFHAAIKVFAKLPEYEASKYSLIKQTIKNGEDPFTDQKMAEIEELSVGNALNAVLMDDNKVASLWNNFLLSAQKSKSDGIKALAEFLSIEDPIVKVPLNQATAIWEHIPLLGMINRIGEIKRGLKQEGGLTPTEANEIARNISRQGLGLLIAGLGALYYKNLGGFQDWRSKKDKKIGVEELGVKINEEKLPKILFHNAAWDIAQMAATTVREMEKGRSGVAGGIGKAGVGVAEETIPFVRSSEELAKTVQALKSGKLSVEAGKFVSKLISTSDTRKLAKYIDNERETNPKTFLEAIENDIPGLRRYVTKKTKK